MVFLGEAPDRLDHHVRFLSRQAVRGPSVVSSHLPGRANTAVCGEPRARRRRGSGERARRNDGAVRLVRAATTDAAPGSRTARRNEYLVGRARTAFGSCLESARSPAGDSARPIEMRLDPPLQPGREAGGLER